jgi:hypothetical protein
LIKLKTNHQNRRGVKMVCKVEFKNCSKEQLEEELANVYNYLSQHCLLARYIRESVGPDLIINHQKPKDCAMKNFKNHQNRRGY